MMVKELLLLFIITITFCSPAQLVRGFTLSDLLDKVMVTGAFPSPPRYLPSFLSPIGFSIPTF